MHIYIYIGYMGYASEPMHTTLSASNAFCAMCSYSYDRITRTSAKYYIYIYIYISHTSNVVAIRSVDRCLS